MPVSARWREKAQGGENQGVHGSMDSRPFQSLRKSSVRIQGQIQTCYKMTYAK